MLSYLQENPEISDVVSEEKTLSIYKLIVDGGLGGQIIISILFVLLAVSLYIYFERFFAIKAASKVDKNFMNQIKDNISDGKLDAATDLCKKTNSPTARLIEKGISRIGKPLDDINKAIENAGKLEVYQLERNVSVIATIAGAAPMIGFLGTVIGMIVAIHEIANAGGQIDIKLLSDGLYTAMTTTVAGLIVGIIAYITYNHIVVRTDKVMYQMEAKTVEFLDLLNEPV
ncbi:MotA/TolQ/ExbB proton channel family protein [Flavobacteriaceae bacterium]|jgi:biopolymer transport protein ExbB|nr:MotA/TolQ/ExbB proton channel family protein [Flavobacteriaceae bacterium]MDA9772981.1 MotA/TolQ/ExbB proton channel family protein [Flavobacteriaceae bacterium]MDB9928230.1 MotA/TolQ/ExbB proton channel family protein [Flavobacteriaceae bacterium]MDC1342696.1 MotA/TolQ/ExbB proton channel family protein [Flavobacteriaceae bacterium]|tara:strand:+ start:409 stop:1095 length:687 start_codon:yes stop_codon:yes gene_type:complete